MKTVKFAPFEPDKAALNGSHSADASGVIPSASGYAPLPSLREDPAVAPLPGLFRGGVAFHDALGNPVVIAATENALYHLRNYQWEEVGGGYNSAGEMWDFARYGNTVIAVNGHDVPVYSTIGADTLTDFQAVPGAPVASSVEVVKEFVVLGGVDKSKIRWSAIGNPLEWPVPGSNDAQYKQADEQDFPDTGQTVSISGSMSGMDLLVFNERAIYRGQYIGSPYFFQFDILDKGRGCLAPESVVTGNNAIYFLSEEGFFATDGAGLRNIGFERVNNWFRDVSDDSRRHEVRAVRDPVTSIIIWTFAGIGAAPEVHDHLLLYHPLLDRWSYGKAETTGVFDGLSLGRSLEALDEYGGLESLPYPLDSRVWKGGVPGVCAFTPDNRMAWLAGSPMEARIDTAETGGMRMIVHGVRPLIDAAVSGVSVLTRDHQFEQLRETDCSPPSAFNGVCYCHISTRYARSRVIVPAGSAWKHAIGCDFLTEEEGAV